MDSGEKSLLFYAAAFAAFAFYLYHSVIAHALIAVVVVCAIALIIWVLSKPGLNRLGVAAELRRRKAQMRKEEQRQQALDDLILSQVTVDERGISSVAKDVVREMADAHQ